MMTWHAIGTICPREQVIRHLWARSAMKLDQTFTAFLTEQLCAEFSASNDELTSNWHHLPQQVGHKAPVGTFSYET